MIISSVTCKHAECLCTAGFIFLNKIFTATHQTMNIWFIDLFTECSTVVSYFTFQDLNDPNTGRPASNIKFRTWCDRMLVPGTTATLSPLKVVEHLFSQTIFGWVQTPATESCSINSVTSERSVPLDVVRHAQLLTINRIKLTNLIWIQPLIWEDIIKATVQCYENTRLSLFSLWLVFSCDCDRSWFTVHQIYFYSFSFSIKWTLHGGDLRKLWSGPHTRSTVSVVRSASLKWSAVWVKSLCLWPSATKASGLECSSSGSTSASPVGPSRLWTPACWLSSRLSAPKPTQTQKFTLIVLQKGFGFFIVLQKGNLLVTSSPPCLAQIPLSAPLLF